MGHDAAGQDGDVVAPFEHADDPALGVGLGRWPDFVCPHARLVEHSGQPRAAVIEYGGFAGMGRRKVAVAWQALRFRSGDAQHRIALLLNRVEMGRIPDFKGTSGPITFGVPGPGTNAGKGN